MTHKLTGAATSVPAIAASAAAAIGCTIKAVYDLLNPPFHIYDTMCRVRADGSCEPMGHDSYSVVWAFLAIVFVVLTLMLRWARWRIRSRPGRAPYAPSSAGTHP